MALRAWISIVADVAIEWHMAHASAEEVSSMAPATKAIFAGAAKMPAFVDPGYSI